MEDKQAIVSPLDRVTSMLLAIQEVKEKHMNPIGEDGKPQEVHFGLIPGLSKKASLFKPGAELICLRFEAVPEFEYKTEDGVKNHKTYHVICKLFHRTTHEYFGMGTGVYSTLQSK